MGVQYYSARGSCSRRGDSGKSVNFGTVLGLFLNTQLLLSPGATHHEPCTICLSRGSTEIWRAHRCLYEVEVPMVPKQLRYNLCLGSMRVIIWVES